MHATFSVVFGHLPGAWTSRAPAPHFQEGGLAMFHRRSLVKQAITRRSTCGDHVYGLVAAVLSGRSLVAMLLALYRVANTSRPHTEDMEELVAYADWAMASQVYDATAQVLSRACSGEGDPIVVTIDNRLPALS